MANHIHDAFEVDVEDHVPVGLAHFEERHARIHTRIVDEDVEPPELAQDLRDHRLGIRGPCDIGLHEHRAPAGRADLPYHRLGRRAIVQVIDGDIRALARERQGDPAPDALLGAGDQRDLSSKPHRCLRPPSALSTCDEYARVAPSTLPGGC